MPSYPPEPFRLKVSESIRLRSKVYNCARS